MGSETSDDLLAAGWPVSCSAGQKRSPILPNDAPGATPLICRRLACVCRLCRIPHKRHTFAVRTLLHWYRTEDNIQAMIPSLSTYMGHREPACTYWYLSAAPELLALAAARRDDVRKAARS
jgi:hypothetical protein